jgi:hypothetical protein
MDTPSKPISTAAISIRPAESGDHATIAELLSASVGSLILFAVFPVGSSAFVRMHWPLSGIPLWDGLLCLAFFLQHSGMVRRGFRDRIAVVVPRQYHRAVYSIASGIVLTGVVILWQPSDAKFL